MEEFEIKFAVNPAEKTVFIADVLISQLDGIKEPLPLDKKASCRVALILEKGIIKEIRLLGENGVFRGGEGWRLREFPRRYLLVPPFIDCHVHLALDGISGFKGLSAPVAGEVILQRLRKAGRAGIVAMRDGGDRFAAGLQARNLSAASGEPPLPQIIATGKALFRNGCYGVNLAGEGISELRQAEEKIRVLHRLGAEQLKVTLSGLVSFEQLGKTGKLQFSLEEMRYIVNMASKYGLPVMAHVNGDEGVRTAVMAGVRSVEHGYFADEETLRMMAGEGVSWVPTVAPVAAFLQALDEGKNVPGRREVIEETIKRHLEMIALAHHLGVRLGVGTDAGSPGVSWGKGFYREMELLARAGIPPADLLTMAAEHGALILGLPAVRGKISTGGSPPWLLLEKEYLFAGDTFPGPAALIHSAGQQ